MASGKEFSGTSRITSVAQLSRMTGAIPESRLAISLVSGGIGSVLAEASPAFVVGQSRSSFARCTL